MKKLLIITLSLVIAMGLSPYLNGKILNADDDGLRLFDFKTVSGDDTTIFSLINNYRTQNGLNALTWHLKSADVDRKHSVNMHNAGELSHEYNGKGPDDRFKDAGISYTTLLENVGMAKGYESNTRQIFDSWKNSSAHNVNMLNSKVTHGAVGIKSSSEKGMYATFTAHKPKKSDGEGGEEGEGGSEESKYTYPVTKVTMTTKETVKEYAIEYSLRGKDKTANCTVQVACQWLQPSQTKIEVSRSTTLKGYIKNLNFKPGTYKCELIVKYTSQSSVSQGDKYIDVYPFELTIVKGEEEKPPCCDLDITWATIAGKAPFARMCPGEEHEFKFTVTNSCQDKAISFTIQVVNKSGKSYVYDSDTVGAGARKIYTFKAKAGEKDSTLYLKINPDCGEEIVEEFGIIIKSDCDRGDATLTRPLMEQIGDSNVYQLSVVYNDPNGKKPKKVELELGYTKDGDIAPPDPLNPRRSFSIVNPDADGYEAEYIWTEELNPDKGKYCFYRFKAESDDGAKLCNPDCGDTVRDWLGPIQPTIVETGIPVKINSRIQLYIESEPIGKDNLFDMTVRVNNNHPESRPVHVEGIFAEDFKLEGIEFKPPPWGDDILVNPEGWVFPEGGWEFDADVPPGSHEVGFQGTVDEDYVWLDNEEPQLIEAELHELEEGQTQPVEDSVPADTACTPIERVECETEPAVVAEELKYTLCACGDEKQFEIHTVTLSNPIVDGEMPCPDCVFTLDVDETELLKCDDNNRDNVFWRVAGGNDWSEFPGEVVVAPDQFVAVEIKVVEAGLKKQPLGGNGRLIDGYTEIPLTILDCKGRISDYTIFFRKIEPEFYIRVSNRFIHKSSNLHASGRGALVGAVGGIRSIGDNDFIPIKMQSLYPDDNHEYYPPAVQGSILVGPDSFPSSSDLTEICPQSCWCESDSHQSCIPICYNRFNFDAQLDFFRQIYPELYEVAQRLDIACSISIVVLNASELRAHCGIEEPEDLGMVLRKDSAEVGGRWRNESLLSRRNPFEYGVWYRIRRNHRIIEHEYTLEAHGLKSCCCDSAEFKFRVVIDPTLEISNQDLKNHTYSRYYKEGKPVSQTNTNCSKDTNDSYTKNFSFGNYSNNILDHLYFFKTKESDADLILDLPHVSNNLAKLDSEYPDEDEYHLFSVPLQTLDMEPGEYHGTLKVDNLTYNLSYTIVCESDFFVKDRIRYWSEDGISIVAIQNNTENDIVYSTKFIPFGRNSNVTVLPDIKSLPAFTSYPLLIKTDNPVTGNLIISSGEKSWSVLIIGDGVGEKESISPVEEVQKIVELWVGKKTAKVNGESVQLPVPPTIIDGNTVVPFRFITETFGADVSWDGAERKITMTFNGLKYKKLPIGMSVFSLPFGVSETTPF